MFLNFVEPHFSRTETSSLPNANGKELEEIPAFFKDVEQPPQNLLINQFRVTHSNEPLSNITDVDTEMTLDTSAHVAPAVGGPLELRRIQLDVNRPEEAIFEIYSVGIYRADVSCLNSKLPAKFPSVFGHEGTYLPDS